MPLLPYASEDVNPSPSDKEKTEKRQKYFLNFSANNNLEINETTPAKPQNVSAIYPVMLQTDIMTPKNPNVSATYPAVLNTVITTPGAHKPNVFATHPAGLNMTIMRGTQKPNSSDLNIPQIAILKALIGLFAVIFYFFAIYPVFPPLYFWFKKRRKENGSLEIQDLETAL